ncbi:Putative odorant receptor 71a [Trachymyrmex septentrionalis]|uniref:Putative odorant receptor 71a n=1 Tax=Trachymyrmex septentrionalis TaxID=34720 RepID=A0A151JSY1_9HYME|nr:Putative odorant receptor 71a [Trachymyrmex septentrionalis]
MQILSLNFLIYNLCGMWRPNEWSSNGAKLLYNVFTFMVIFSEYFLVVTQFLDIVLIVDNIDDFATNTLMFLTIVAVCCKATIVVIRRNAINNLIQLLMETPCKPRDEDEIAIKTKFDIFIRSCLIKYMLLSMSSLTGVTIGSVVNIMQGYLPYRIWLPFNHTIPLAFWTISIHQIVTLIFATMINVSTDILVLGLFLHTCAQFEIFESRLHKLVLFVQFFASILVLCTSVYYLSIHIRDFSGILPFLVYTIGMFVQIYIYCWSGNEVILKSMSIGDAVYCMDWPLLSVNEKKQLLMVMVRSTIPIKFTSSFLITVSLQSYSSVILIVDNIDDFATNTLMFLTIVAVCCKATVVVVRRNAITNLMQVLMKTPCKPCDEDEVAIQSKYDMFIRSCSIKYSLLATSSVTGTTIGSVLNIMQGHLPYRIWLPYNYNVSTMFWAISVHQIITVIFSAMINIGTDTLIFGLILHTCAQLKIFESRLQKLMINRTIRFLESTFSSSNKNKTGISECIRHHLSIYKYAKTVNVIFNQVLFVQFFASILVLCTSVYYLSIHITELSGTATFLVYTIGMFIQIYIYCWCGNEVILKSISIGDAIYCMDWPLLSVNEKKELLIVMIRSTIPIKFTSSFLITLSLQSYSNVKEISKMQMFSLNFCMYTICGIWRPIEWSSNGANFLYNVFTYIILFLEYFFMLTQFLDFLFVIDNIDDFIANSIIFVSVAAMICKATVVVIRRNAIISLIQILLKGPCKPQDEDEIAIQTKFENFVRLCSKKYLLLALISLTGVIIGSVLNIMQGQLPCRIWLPFDYNVSLVFWIISIQQVIAIIAGTIINVATETLSISIGEAIYCMNWPLLSITEKKELLMIMIRSTIPIKFTSSFMITLSLQSYSNVRSDPNMQMLSFNFFIYTVGGIWRPVEWSSSGAKLLYNVFTFIIISSEYFLVLTQFMDIILIVDNIDDFATNTLMFLTIVAVCCKATVVVVRRNAIINLMQILLKAPYKPRDEDEVAIQTKFDKFIRSCSIKYSLLATSSVTGTTIGSVLNVMQGHLPYRIWLPCNYNVTTFWAISVHQIITVIFATMINVGTETLVFGLILQTCAQLEIFKSRLHKFIIKKTVTYLGHARSLSNEDKTCISECIRDHLSIYKYAKTVNIIFNQVLFVQFFSSILVLCTSVYYLSMHVKDLSAAAPLLVYTICMFVQIFVYCWSGNEVMLKSMSITDAIYRMDWPLLSINEKKGLLMIMIRSTIPVKFTSSFLITLSLQSYSNVMIFVVNNVDDFATNTLMFLSIVAVCCKTTVIVVRRNAIINLVQVLLKAPYKPRDKDEIAIQTKFDRFIRSCSIKYSLLATSSITGGTIGSVLNIMQGHLPYRIWLPCDYNVSTIFWTVSIHQVVTIIFATVINVGTETLVFGLILQTCAQFEILESRLQKLIINKTVKYLRHASCLSNENKTGLSECICHHLSIYKYAKAVNVIFNQVLFVQFFSSILILCTSVYYLSMHVKDLSAAAPLLVYTICMFVQIYFYCWSGNEVIFKSMNLADAIYNMNWPLLSINEKKGLLMIMIRSTIPIKFTSSFLITLSLQSYSNVSMIWYQNKYLT